MSRAVATAFQQVLASADTVNKGRTTHKPLEAHAVLLGVPWPQHGTQPVFTSPLSGKHFPFLILWGCFSP